MPVMLQDMFKIQAALGGSSGQGGFPAQRQNAPDSDKEESPDYGAQGRDPDCRIFLAHGVTTMVWLKSHHLMSAL